MNKNKTTKFDFIYYTKIQLSLLLLLLLLYRFLACLAINRSYTIYYIVFRYACTERAELGAPDPIER